MPTTDPIQRKAYMRAWVERNREKTRIYAARSYQKHRAKWAHRNRRYTLQRNYRITLEEYQALLLAQGGVCAVCEKPQKSGRKLAVDHDHETGLVRGLLCQSCNGKLEKFKRYLDAHYEIENEGPQG